MQAGFNQLKDFPTTFWLGLFVEGTRFNQKNLEAAKVYASLKGLPTPRNVLIPRTKVSLTITFASLHVILWAFAYIYLHGLQHQGFVSAVTHMRSFVPAIYDCTYTVQKKQTTPILLRMFGGQSSEVTKEFINDSMCQLYSSCFRLIYSHLCFFFFSEGEFADETLQNEPSAGNHRWHCTVVPRSVCRQGLTN